MAERVVFAWPYQICGLSGLLLLKIGLLSATFYLLASIARQADAEHRGWILAITLLTIAPSAITFRPQLWTLFGLAILCRLLSRGTHLGWLVVLFALWANLHGGWIVGMAVLMLWLCGRMIDTRSILPHIPAALITIIALGATWINPYGWRLWEFLCSTIRINREITEWNPLWRQSHTIFAGLWVVTAGILIITLIFRWRQIHWATCLPVIGLGLGSVRVARLAPLFAEVAIIAISQGWRILPKTLGDESKAANPPRDID